VEVPQGAEVPPEVPHGPAPASKKRRALAEEEEQEEEEEEEEEEEAGLSGVHLDPPTAARKGKVTRTKRARAEPRAEPLENTPEAAAKALGNPTLNLARSNALRWEVAECECVTNRVHPCISQRPPRAATQRSSRSFWRRRSWRRTSCRPG
jgi:hypothetical protein